MLDVNSRYYYASPDRPTYPELDTAAYALKHPGVDCTDHGVTELRSQRNRLPKNPVRLQRSGNYYPIFAAFIASLQRLRYRLDRETHPEAYGRGSGTLESIAPSATNGLTSFIIRRTFPPVSREDRSCVNDWSVAP